MKHRRKLAAAILAGTIGLLGLAGPAAAEYPERPISLIVPWPPGGATDLSSRTLAQIAEKALGQPIVVVNRSGAAGFIGMSAVAHAKPDGYTIGTMSTSHFLGPLTGTKTNFEPLDLTYVMNYGDNLIAVAVRADSPWRTLNEAIEHSRKKGLTYGTAGVNSAQHIMMESVAKASGADFVHVPYQGSAASVPALLGGHVDLLMEVSAWAPYVKSGQMRLLAVSTPVRSDVYPDVPTLKELGFDSLRSMQAIVAPKGLPEPIRARLETAFRAATADPAFQNTITQLSMQVVDQPGAEVKAFVERETGRARDMIVPVNATR